MPVVDPIRKDLGAVVSWVVGELPITKVSNRIVSVPPCRVIVPVVEETEMRTV